MKSLLHPESTNLHSSRYDEAAKELFVTFKDGSNAGKTWRYSGVEPHVFAGLENAQSAGKFFYNAIRSKYRGEPVE